MAERNIGVPQEKRIDFRIGINVGDIIIDGDDIFCDGVNVAARLEALAEPGGICVSRVVRDQVLDKLSFDFEDIGAQKVKNIVRPVEAYRVNVGSDALPAAVVARRRWRRLAGASAARWLGAAVAAVVVVGIALLVASRVEKAPQRAEAPAFSLAVIPFTVLGAHPQATQVADLVTNGIVAAVGRSIRYVKVVSPARSDQAIDMRSIVRESNVRYMLEGNVRVEDDTVNVVVKLISTENAIQVWTGQYAGPRSKWTSDTQDAALAVSHALGDAIWKAEEQRVAHQSSKNASTPAELVLRAAVLERHPDPKRLLQARALVDEALQQDPNSILALRERMIINMLLYDNDPNADRAKLGLEMDEFARRALAIDRTDPGVWRDRAAALSMLWRWDAAFDALEEAHRLGSSYEADVVARTWLLSLVGKPEQGVKLAEEALARDSTLDLKPNFRHNQCYANLLLGRFGEAVAPCEKSVAGGDDWWPYFFLTVAYAQTGDVEKAAASKAELIRRRPSFTIAQLDAMGLSDNAVYLKQAEANIIPGLRKAGIPEK